MEEREDLMALLIAVGDEIFDRGEDPALGELVDQLMDWLLDDDTSEIADDARATLAFTTSGAAPLDASISRSSTVTRMPAARHRRTHPGHSLSVHGGVHVQGPGPAPHHARGQGQRGEAGRVLAVLVSRLALPWCTTCTGMALVLWWCPELSATVVCLRYVSHTCHKRLAPVTNTAPPASQSPYL